MTARQSDERIAVVIDRIEALTEEVKGVRKIAEVQAVHAEQIKTLGRDVGNISTRVWAVTIALISGFAGFLFDRILGR